MDKIVSTQLTQIEKKIATDNAYTQTVGIGLGGLIAIIVIGGAAAAALGGKKDKKKPGDVAGGAAGGKKRKNLTMSSDA